MDTHCPFARCWEDSVSNAFFDLSWMIDAAQDTLSCLSDCIPDELEQIERTLLIVAQHLDALNATRAELGPDEELSWV